MPIELTARRYGIAVGAVLAAEASLLLWNASRYDWLHGYDAYANDRYVVVVADEHRLPSKTESGVWHTPPLWFALAGALRHMTTAIGWGHPQRPAQLLAAAAGLCVCALAFMIARELWPGRRLLHLVALVLVATSPALVRASAMYHPETLAVALATAGALVAIRALRIGWTLPASIGAGLLLGFAALTRAWALPVLAAVAVAAILDARGHGRWLPVATLVTASVVVVAMRTVGALRAMRSAADSWAASSVAVNAGFVTFTTPTGSPSTRARKFWSCWLPSGESSATIPHRSRTIDATSTAGRFGAGSSPAPKKSSPRTPALPCDIRAPFRSRR